MASRKRRPHEDRVRDTIAVVAPEAEIEQELSIPTKARRLDFVYAFREPCAAFGPLASLLSDRVVLMEPQSRPATLVDVWNAFFGAAWLGRQRVRRLRPAQSERWSVLQASRHPPIGVVHAPAIQTDARTCLAGLHASEIDGVWVSADVHRGGLVLIDATLAGSVPGMSVWNFMLYPEAKDPERRLDALTNDSRMSTMLKERLKEAVMNNEIATTPEESTSAYQRAVLEGEVRGEVRGEAAGRRSALLEVAAKLVPERLEALTAIQDANDLQATLFDAIAKRDATGR